MTTLVPNQPIRTREPRLTIDGNLPLGRHRFRLVVVDNDGNRSAPDEIIVAIVRGIIDPFPNPLDPRRPPTPIDPGLPPLDPRRPNTPIDPPLPPIDIIRSRGVPREGDEQ